MNLRSTSPTLRAIIVLTLLALCACDDDDGGSGGNFPLFGLERTEICASWCDRFAECLPDVFDSNDWPYGERDTCIDDCQETLDTAWANTGRPDCGRAIDSFYACQGAIDCHEFEAGRSPNVEPIACEAVDARFYDLCIL